MPTWVRIVVSSMMFLLTTGRLRIASAATPEN
jgi:hypothetical protein